MKRIAIIGGGAIGSSVGYHLRKLIPEANVRVFERDPSYTKASSALSAASIRQQFSSPVNIQLSLSTLEFLRSVRDRIDFVEGGYLFLANTKEGAETLASNAELQNRLGAKIQYLGPSELALRFPWLHSADLMAGTFGESGEGWFDGFSLLQLLRRMAIDNGVTFTAGNVVRLETSNNAIRRVWYVPFVGSSAPDSPAAPAATETAWDCDLVVNAAGPWSRAVAAMAGVDLPVFARRRVVHVVESDQPLSRCPLTIDSAGIYFRGDGTQPLTKRFLVGHLAPPEDEDPSDLPLEIGESDTERFEQVMWPILASRVPALECLCRKASWAGYYEVHPMDHNAIIGPHPTKIPNLLFVNGFSGHGLQQSYAVGKCVAELVEFGKYTSLDLSELGFERVLCNKPLLEKNVI